MDLLGIWVGLRYVFRGNEAHDRERAAELSAQTAEEGRRKDFAEKQRLAAMSQEELEIEFGLTDKDLDELDLSEHNNKSP